MMSDRQSVMKFEYLPNEILLECFQYLNTFEIFYSFNQLNNRIDILINNIPLSINFDNVNKLIFDQFCKINPEIKNKIYSLKVSNEDQCFQAKIFLSYFPLDKLSSLQNFQLVNPMKFFDFPLMRRVKPDPGFYLDIKVSDLLSFKLRTLTIPYLCESVFDIHPISSIINLTIGLCSTDDFYQILKQFPQLNYLRINHVKKSFADEIDTNEYGIHLEKLILDKFDDKFKNFERFVKQIPNLKSLTISNSLDMIDANRWKQLITSSLPYLNKFKFKFHSSTRRNQRYTIIDKFKEFQTDFWQNKHWYTEYIVRDTSLFIHTIPYPFNKYSFELNQSRHSNSINTFVNVTHLTTYLRVFNEDYQDYFPNVSSLSLSTVSYGSYLTDKYIQYLKQIINLSNIKRLEIMKSLRLDDPLTLLELFKQTPQLSSMEINGTNLQLSFQNEELCQYFNKMIRILDIDFWKNIQLNQFCQIFSNLEHLTCWIDHQENLIFLIANLPKLSTLNANFRCKENPDIKLFRFKTEAEKFNVIYHIKKTFIDCDTDADTDEEDARDYYKVKIFIWIGNKTLFH
jgi:hypothetical protein